MDSPSNGIMMLLMVLLGLGCVIAGVILNDILRYRDLQRRLWEEQSKREETGSR